MTKVWYQTWWPNTCPCEVEEKLTKADDGTITFEFFKKNITCAEHTKYDGDELYAKISEDNVTNNKNNTIEENNTLRELLKKKGVTTH